LNSSKVAAPFPSPKHSQASQSGSREKLATQPNPPIAFLGAFSLKKNGAPGVPRNA